MRGSLHDQEMTIAKNKKARVVTRCGCRAGLRVTHDPFVLESMLSLMTNVGFRPCRVMNLL